MVVVCITLRKTVRLIVLQACLFIAVPLAVLTLEASASGQYRVGVFWTALVLFLLWISFQLRIKFYKQISNVTSHLTLGCIAEVFRLYF